jgi:hypothetical protein
VRHAHPAVFRAGERVEVHQFDGQVGIDPVDELGDGVKVGGERRVARHHRDADEDPPLPAQRGREPAQVLDDQLVAEAGGDSMGLRIGDLHIDDESIDELQQRLDRRPGGAERRLEGRRRPGRLQPRGDITDEARLIEGLAAGERDPASRHLVEDRVPEDLGDHLIDRDVPSIEGERVPRTRLDAVPTARACSLVDRDAGRPEGDRAYRAHLDAPARPAAQVVEVPERDPAIEAFGVLAPAASERTALQEDRGADARPVMDRESLHVEDPPSVHESS